MHEEEGTLDNMQEFYSHSFLGKCAKINSDNPSRTRRNLYVVIFLLFLALLILAMPDMERNVRFLSASAMLITSSAILVWSEQPKIQDCTKAEYKSDLLGNLALTFFLLFIAVFAAMSIRILELFLL